MVRVGVPVGTDFFYDDAADFINVTERFHETRQAARIITGQEFSRSLTLRLNGVVAGAAKHQETILVGAANLGQKLERLTHAGVLKIRHREAAFFEGPIGNPVFGPRIQEVADPESISSEIVALQHERR